MTNTPEKNCVCKTWARICTTCQRKIPSGHKYWYKELSDGDKIREHTNCDLYTKEEYRGNDYD